MKQPRFLPWWAPAVRVPTGIAVWTYMHLAYRIRGWGKLPRDHASTLIVANHQIEIDLMELAAGFYLTAGRRSPVLIAGARLMREPGFLAIRLRWLWRLLHNAALGWLFDGLGLLPIENELQSRSIARWAWAVQRMHGALPLERIFKEPALARFGFTGLTSNDLFKSRYFQRAQSVYVRVSELQQPFAREQLEVTRKLVEEDLARIRGVLRRGAAFFMTPEGEYSPDGAMKPFRAIWKELVPLAKRVQLYLKIEDRNTWNTQT